MRERWPRAAISQEIFNRISRLRVDPVSAPSRVTGGLISFSFKRGKNGVTRRPSIFSFIHSHPTYPNGEFNLGMDSCLKAEEGGTQSLNLHQNRNRNENKFQRFAHCYQRYFHQFERVPPLLLRSSYRCDKSTHVDAYKQMFSINDSPSKVHQNQLS